jgi:hypothetical protein
LVGTLLIAAIVLTAKPGNTVAPAKSASSRTKHTGAETKAVSPKIIKTGSTHPTANLHRDLLNLEEGQKGLQRQLETLNDATRRHANDLERQIDNLTSQLKPLVSAQQQVTEKQQALTATIRSMERLLMISVGFLLILCGALFFFVYQLKQIVRSPLRKSGQMDTETGKVPDHEFERQWKVSS